MAPLSHKLNKQTRTYKCSACNESGHNKRSCVSLSNVSIQNKNKNKDKRKPCENACTELLFAGIVTMLCDGIDITNITLNCMINYVKDINEENVPGYYYVNPSILDCDDVDEYLHRYMGKYPKLTNKINTSTKNKFKTKQ